MRTRVLLWVVLGALLGLVACSGGGEDPSEPGQRPASGQRLTNAEWEQVARESGRYLGSEVDLTGEVFNVLGTYEGAFHFQMYTDPSTRKGNTHVAVTVGGGQVRSGDEVRVVGRLDREQVTTSVAGTELRVPYVVVERVAPAGQDLASSSPPAVLAIASPAPPESAASPAPVESLLAAAAPAASQAPATQEPFTQPPVTQALPTQAPPTQAAPTATAAPLASPTRPPASPAPLASSTTPTPAPSRVVSAAPTATRVPPTPAPTAGPTRAPSTPTAVPSPTRVVASAPPPSPVPTAPPTSRPASPAPTAEARGDTVVVAAGDTLSGIAARVYGDASQYRRLYEANRDQLSSPDQIKPGQRLRVPR